GRRDERPRLQARFGDAEQHRVTSRRLLPLVDRLGIDLVEFRAVDLLALQELRLAGVVDLDLLQHLANDHLDVLVVDGDALQPVDLLDLVDQIGREFLDTLDGENVVRSGVALDEVIALLDDVAVLQVDVLALRDQVLARLLALVRRLDREPALVLVVLAESHGAADLGDDRRFLRTPRLEQFRHPRQTAGDVAGLGALGRDTRDDVAGLHVAARIDRQNRVDRELVARVAAAGELQDLPVRLDHDRRTQVLLIARRARAPVDDHALGDAGRFVELLRHRQAVDEILELDLALDLGENRPGVGIPLGDTRTALDHLSVFDAQPRAVLDTVMRTLGAVRIEHGHDHVAHHHDRLAVRVLRDVRRTEDDLAGEVRLDERLLGNLSSAADVERTHGELGARLADRLRRNDADRLAHVHRRTAGEIAPVA